jgi:hypothetical protein
VAQHILCFFLQVSQDASATFFLRPLYRLRTARFGCLETFMIPPSRWRVLVN